ncbi:unnamed protein product [Linum tenue]|uniref:FAD-binding domain-containing protein n=1 Tax=Linum tenue TaxID=586396 RepID=A0AAV0IDF3_9ROSI|nr:unnamed protein product [Linum tenue]
MKTHHQHHHHHDIVIVGGGICGLATALALHRKGIRSTVIERSETLRAAGAGIIVHENGWKALELLGVASTLRLQTPISITSGEVVSVKDGKRESVPSWGEVRAIRRSDLIGTLASELPADSFLLGCKVVGVHFHPTTSEPLLYLHDGTVIHAKVVVGCDGLKSVVAKTSLRLDSEGAMPISATRGFSYSPEGHNLGDKFVVHKDVASGSLLGEFPLTPNLLYWFLLRPSTPQDSVACKDKKLIKESSLETVKDYPPEAQATVRNSDEESLHLSESITYRRPWDVLTKKFRRGTVTVAGDAMHAMGPFLAQGGSTSLEDAVVLADCMAAELLVRPPRVVPMVLALDEYVDLRRKRVFWLSLNTYLLGAIASPSSSRVTRSCCILLKKVLFSDPFEHLLYDCRRS